MFFATKAKYTVFLAPVDAAQFFFGVKWTTANVPSSSTPKVTAPAAPAAERCIGEKWDEAYAVLEDIWTKPQNTQVVAELESLF